MSTNQQPAIFHRTFVTTMNLLGFHHSQISTKNNVSITVDTFKQSNSQAFQSVMYFLFDKLDSEKAKFSFRDCWPVCDKKTEAAFRRVCCTWIESICKDDKDATFQSRIGPLLMSPHGPKFLIFVYKFSSYVMKKDLLRLGGPAISPMLSCPNVDGEDRALFLFAEVLLKNAIHDHVTLHAECQQKRLQNYLSWKETMVYPIDMHRKMTQEISEAKQKEVRLASQNNRYKPSPDMEINVSEKCKTVTDAWNKISAMAAIDEENWEILSSFLTGRHSRHCLDGAELNVEIPDILLGKATEFDLKQEDLDGLVKNNEIDLAKFAKFAFAAIKLYVMDLQQKNPFPELKKMAAFIEKCLERHTFISKRLDKLKLELVTTIDNLSKSTREDLEEILARISFKDIQDLPGDFLPNTPPLNLLGGNPLNLGSPFETPNLSTTSPHQAPHSINSIPLVRNFKRSCSPLVFDALDSPTNQLTEDVQGNGWKANRPLLEIEVGCKVNKQWTKVTTNMLEVEASNRKTNQIGAMNLQSQEKETRPCNLLTLPKPVKEIKQQAVSPNDSSQCWLSPTSTAYQFDDRSLLASNLLACTPMRITENSDSKTIFPRKVFSTQTFLDKHGNTDMENITSDAVSPYATNEERMLKCISSTMHEEDSQIEEYSGDKDVFGFDIQEEGDSLLVSTEDSFYT